MGNPAKLFALADQASKIGAVIDKIGTLDADKDGVADLTEAKALLVKILADSDALKTDFDKLAKLLEADAKALGIEDLLKVV